jgi:hypothetical protein
MVLLLACSQAATAEVVVRICHGYGCLTEAEIRYEESRLAAVGALMLAATDAESERVLLGQAIGKLYGWAGEQSAIRNDRGGNFADAGIHGMMDCIDHSTSTTRLLHLLDARGALRWHRVLAPEVRNWALIFPAHYSAVIEEIGGGEASRFVVDSWFVDNGEAAVILPLSAWKKGAGPDV